MNHLAEGTKSVLKNMVVTGIILGIGYTIGRIKGMDETMDAHSRGKKPPMLRKLNAIGELFGLIEDDGETAEFGSFDKNGNFNTSENCGKGRFSHFPTPRYINDDFGDIDTDFDKEFDDADID